MPIGQQRETGKNWKLRKYCLTVALTSIFNLGEDCITDNGRYTLQNEKIYLVGTMINFKETRMNSETNLLGIRFKPAAFSAFYKFSVIA